MDDGGGRVPRLLLTLGNGTLGWLGSAAGRRLGRSMTRGCYRVAPAARQAAPTTRRRTSPGEVGLLDQDLSSSRHERPHAVDGGVEVGQVALDRPSGVRYRNVTRCTGSPVVAAIVSA